MAPRYSKAWFASFSLSGVERNEISCYQMLCQKVTTPRSSTLTQIGPSKMVELTELSGARICDADCWAIFLDLSKSSAQVWSFSKRCRPIVKPDGMQVRERSGSRIAHFDLLQIEPVLKIALKKALMNGQPAA
jgi:hypothetical protein